MNCDVFIPVRLASTRLLSKHMRHINGKPAIKCLIERVRQAKKIRKIVVCTTNLQSDDPLINFLKKENVDYFRGSDKDILQRFLDAARKFNTDLIIDVEGDKIYTDPMYIDKIIQQMQQSNIDFMMGNDSLTKFDPTNHFIHGVVPAGIKFHALEKICKIKNTSNTETGYKEFFLIDDIINAQFLILENSASKKNIRLTLDYEEDLVLANRIFKKLGTYFTTDDLVQLFNENPSLLKINESLKKKWEENYEKTKSKFS